VPARLIGPGPGAGNGTWRATIDRRYRDGSAEITMTVLGRRTEIRPPPPAVGRPPSTSVLAVEPASKRSASAAATGTLGHRHGQDPHTLRVQFLDRSCRVKAGGGAWSPSVGG